MAALERRHLSQLGFAEVRRALQALSSLYVERRGRLASGAALESEGKRAAFALFYGPLHFLVVRGMVRALGASSPPPGRIVDLGCGSGAAGAAWALEAGGRADSWRLPAALPERWRLLDRAAGLDHRELTGRSLWLVSAEAGSGSSSRAPAR